MGNEKSNDVMKRKNILKFAALALLATTIVSCADWLEVKPRSQEEAERLFGTEDGFKEALAGCYTILCQPELYGRELTFGTIGLLGQEWGSGGNIGSNNSREYLTRRYNYTSDAVRPYLDNVWINMYKAIANVNTLLDYTVSKKSVLTADNYAAIRGEALALRAFVHFDLMRMYSKYDGENTYSDSYLAIPYIKDSKPIITSQFTNKEVIDFILDDIDAALELLVADPIYTGRDMSEVDNGYLLNRQRHLNYYAVVGLKARVCQYAGMDGEARSAAQTVVSAQQQKGLFRWVTGDEANPAVTVNRDRTYSSEHLFALNTVKLEENIKGYFWGDTRNPWVSRLVVETMFDGGDYRRRNFETYNGVSDVFAKFWQYGLQSGGFRPVRNLLPMIRITEMYYILAESYASANPDESLRLLNIVRAARNLDALTFGEGSLPEAKTTYVMGELLKEYQREFIGEGQLWFFHKRQETDYISTAYTNYVFPMPENEIDYGQREDTTTIITE